MFWLFLAFIDIYRYGNSFISTLLLIKNPDILQILAKMIF